MNDTPLAEYIAPGHEVRARLDDGFADVAGRVLRPCPCSRARRRAAPRASPIPASDGPAMFDAGRDRVTGDAGRRRGAEQRSGRARSGRCGDRPRPVALSAPAPAPPAPCSASVGARNVAPVTRIGRGGQPWLSTLLTQSRNAMRSVISLVATGPAWASAAGGSARRRTATGRACRPADTALAALLRDLGQVGRVVGAFAEQGMAVDAVVLVPDVLAASDLGRDVLGVGECGNCRWLSIVSAMKTSAAMPVHPMANSRPPFRVMGGRSSHGDARPVHERDAHRVDEGRGHGGEHYVAQDRAAVRRVRASAQTLTTFSRSSGARGI